MAGFTKGRSPPIGHLPLPLADDPPIVGCMGIKDMQNRIKRYCAQRCGSGRETVCDCEDSQLA
jgi:hypothetical protein